MKNNFVENQRYGKWVMKEGEFIIYRNRRTKPNDFKMEYRCDFCDDFVPTVIGIPGTQLFICSSCLNKMQEAINKFVVFNRLKNCSRKGFFGFR